MVEKGRKEQLTRAEICEKFQNLRLKIASSVAEKIKQNPDLEALIAAADRIRQDPDFARFVSALGNGVGKFGSTYIKLGLEIYHNKTADGQVLKPLGRLVDVLMFGTGLGFWAMVATGHIKTGWPLYATSWGLYFVMYSSDLIAPVLNAAAGKLEKNPSQSSQFAAKTLKELSRICDSPKKLFFLPKS